jgi:hypothetical protein
MHTMYREMRAQRTGTSAEVALTYGFQNSFKRKNDCTQEQVYTHHTTVMAFQEVQTKRLAQASTQARWSFFRIPSYREHHTQSQDSAAASYKINVIVSGRTKKRGT